MFLEKLGGLIKGIGSLLIETGRTIKELDKATPAETDRFLKDAADTANPRK